MIPPPHSLIHSLNPLLLLLLPFSLMDSSRLHTIVLNGGDGADGLALVHIQQEDDDDRAADGEEFEVGGCPCDGAGHAAANEVRDDEDKDDDNGHDDEDALLLEDEDLEEIQQLQLMAEQSFLRDDEAVDDDSEDDAVNQDEDGIADAILSFAALALESTREVS